MDFFDRLVYITEAVLSGARRRKRLRREKQAGKNALVDWLEAFIWAGSVVLLVNQYLFQAYQIPSGSMIDTLLIGDRIFVNKFIYGPELLPGIGKLPSPVNPRRNDVIIFESPSYMSRGPAFDIAQRVIFMLSFSLIDIDKDEFGRPKAHFLIKRAIGMPGDRIVNRNGDMMLQFAGETRLVPETEYNAARGTDTHTVRRIAKASDYAALNSAIKADTWLSLGISTPSYISVPAENDLPRRIEGDTYEQERYAVQRALMPHEERLTSRYYRKLMGRYVPEGRILPLGDNRDSSLDGRSFGPVRTSKILGRGFFIWWPGSSVEDGERNAPPLNPPASKTGLRRMGLIK